MTRRTDTIEVDQDTADVLKTRAAERGISVAELLNEVVINSGLIEAEAATLAELDRRWAKIVAGEPTTPHHEVVRWLETWGTPAFRPWREQ